MYTAPRSQGVYFHPRELEGSESVKDDEAGAALEDLLLEKRCVKEVRVITMFCKPSDKEASPCQNQPEEGGKYRLLNVSAS